MVDYSTWCTSTDTQLGNRYLRVMTSISANAQAAIADTAAIVPSHYASEEKIAGLLTRLGKPAAAQMIESLLPQTRQIRSGDLGEIYATEWIDGTSGYRAPIKRLRWGDHREMAMRGDDVIGMKIDDATHRLKFLKTEAKSRANLQDDVLQQARKGLDKDTGLPSAHSLAFISSRLLEMGIDKFLTDAIDNELYKHGIPASNVTHLLFTFTGNAPTSLLTQALQSYKGQIVQWAIGLHVSGHTAHVEAVYDAVIANANQL